MPPPPFPQAPPCPLLPEDTALLEDGDGLCVGQSSDSIVYLQLVLPNASKKKTIRVAPGAGGRLQLHSDILVTVHNKLTGFGESTVVSSRAACVVGENPSFVLESFAGAWDDLQEDMYVFDGKAQHWILPFDKTDCRDARASDAHLCSLLQQLISIGAHPSGSRPQGIALQDIDLTIARVLEGHGYLNSNSDRWALTQKGLT